MNLKKIISVAVAAMIVIAAVCMPASALMGEVSGVRWEITDGTLTVSGASIPDFTASAAAPWTKFAHLVTKIVVGDGVSAIGERGFEDMDSVGTVSLGGAKAIGRMAFSGCTSLKSVTLPEGVTVIGDFAFAECEALTRVAIPKTVKMIGEDAWEGCVSLATITSSSESYPVVGGVLIDKSASAILRYPPARKTASYTVPDGITAIGAGAFRDAVYVESVSLGGADSIGDGAFRGCVALRSVDILSAKTVGRAAFHGCESLLSVKFGASLTEIGDDAFGYCTSLGVADFAGNAPSANEGIFFGCGSAFTVTVRKDADGFGNGTTWLGYPVIRHGVYSGEVGTVKWSIDTESGGMIVTGLGALPDFESPADAPWYEYRRIVQSLAVTGVTGIGMNNFRYLSAVSVVIGPSVKRIGEFAFSGCPYLEEVTGNGVETVGACAFFASPSLLHVRMGGVLTLGDQAFAGCDALDWAYFGKTAPSPGKFVFDGTDVCVIYPVGSSGYSSKAWEGIATEQYLAGDANGDGRVNLADVSLVLKYTSKWDVRLCRVSADVTCDGRVNLADVSLVLKHIARWDVEMGIGNLM